MSFMLAVSRRGEVAERLKAAVFHFSNRASWLRLALKAFGAPQGQSSGQFAEPLCGLAGPTSAVE
jgi:hypothetical protein